MIRLLIGLTLLFMIGGCGGSSDSTGYTTSQTSTIISPSPGSSATSTSSPNITTPGPTKLSQSRKSAGSDPILDQTFADSVSNYIRDSWGTWAKGDAIGRCLIGNAETMTKESKEGVIEHGIEEAFGKLSGKHLNSLSAAWDLCESGADTAAVSSRSQFNGPKPESSAPTPGPMVNFESPAVYKPFPPSLATQFQDAIDKPFDGYTKKAGISAAVYKDGYIWRYAKGDASSSTSMTVGTPTLIRSSSKSFTAGLVLKQIDDGLYSLSDTLETILSGNVGYETLDKLVINPDITVEELLTMTSGIGQIQDYYREEVSVLQSKLDWQPIDLVQLVIVDSGQPGSYDYSNTNTMLLGMIAEHAGKQRLNDLYKTELFNPLDIVALLLPQDGAPPNTARPHDDREYWGGTGFGDILESADWHQDWYMSTGRMSWNAAGIITTPENMAKWAYELFSAHGSALSPTARATLLESFTGPLIEIGALEQQYGYHSTKREIALSDMEISAYGHPGSGGGYISDFYYSPELDLSLSILVNSHTEARTRQDAQGAVTHSGLNEIAWEIFDAYARQ